MITKDQAAMLKQLSGNVINASGRYDAIRFTEAIKDKRMAYEELATTQKVFNDYVDSLVAQ